MNHLGIGCQKNCTFIKQSKYYNVAVPRFFLNKNVKIFCVQNGSFVHVHVVCNVDVYFIFSDNMEEDDFNGYTCIYSKIYFGKCIYLLLV